ncbi:MAG: Dicer-like protein 1 [Watsoniomyces obsoletus]|nr:MAG: Dicer-like protein 1 [Watsoniomyces obsoletus]
MASISRNLREIFEDAERRRESVESPSASSSDEYPEHLRAAISAYEECRRAVERLALFSPNESVEDISSRDLQYLVIDFHIAELTSRIPRVDRRTTLRDARARYDKFLRLLDAYGLLEGDDKRLYERFQEAPDSFSTATMTDPAARRDTKIARYRQEKALKDKLEHLGRQYDEEDEDEADDMTLRSVNRTRIILCVHAAFASLESIAVELQILALPPPSPPPPRTGPLWDHRMLFGRQEGDQYSERLDPPVAQLLANGRGGPLLSKEGRPLQPFTLLDQRDQLRQGVFRPSHNLPTMTIDEYLEEERRRGGIIEGGGAASGQRAEPDEDDMKLADEATMKAREWDEFTEANPKCVFFSSKYIIARSMVRHIRS